MKKNSRVRNAMAMAAAAGFTSLFLGPVILAQNGSVATMATERVDGSPSGKQKTESKIQTINKALPSSLNPQPDLITGTSYPFAAAGGAALEDMSSGTAQLLGPGLDDSSSSLTSIGFDFWYDGVRTLQFSANANGLIRLGSAVVTASSINNLDATTDAPKVAPYWENQCTGTNGKVHYKVIGSAPNRKLVVEWQNMQISRGAACSGAGNGTYQAWLFEGTGVIKFVYGALPAPAAADGGYSVGLQSGVATNFASVTTSGNTVSYAAANDTQNTAIAGGTAYTFTPNLPTAPTNLTFTGTTALAMTVNWTDNASNEIGYVIYNSTDGTNFTFVSQTAANATSQAFSGLDPNTNYFWRVYALTEGALSTVLAGSHSTNALGNITSTAAGGNWSAPATWVGGVVPSATDNVTIADAATVVINTAAVAYNVTVGQGGSGLLKFDTVAARSLTVTKDVTVAGNGTFSTEVTVASTVTTHSLSLGGSLTANGTLDFCTNPGFGGTNAGASITFTGASNATFSGPGTFPVDVRAITVNKGTNPDSIVELNFPANFTVRGVNTNVAGFLTQTNGTLKISGNFTMTNRVFTAVGYTIPATAGFWLNNPNFIVTGQNASCGQNGLLRISQGTFNIGTMTGNSMGFGDGSSTNVEGGVVAATGRFGVAASGNAITYDQSGGTITVCTVGNASTGLASFDLGQAAASTVNITGGTIICQLANTGGSGPRDYRHQAGATGTATVTGGTVQLGNAASGAAKAFSVVGIFPDLVITNTSANHSAAMLVPVGFNNITRNITINPGTTFNIGNATLLFNGTTLTNNGTLTANGASSTFTWFNSTAPILYTGTGVVTAPMTNFGMQAAQGVTINAASPNIPVIGLRMFSGNITNANRITVGDGGATTGTIQFGNSGSPTAAGNLDVSPTFNLGTGGLVVNYLRTTTPRTTGPEINLTRTLTSLTYDDNDPTHTLTIAGGDITLTATAALFLTNGRIVTGANTLILSSAAISGVQRSAGYVDGNLRRPFAAAGFQIFDVGTANGYSRASITVTAGSFPASLTVRATATRQPNYPGSLTALKRYWTITDPVGLTIGTGTNFTYLAGDVVGNEANYKLKRFSGTFTSPTSNVNVAMHIGNLTTNSPAGGDWTLFELDTDFDGMPDSYETANSLDPNNASDAGGDADQDGQTNLAEYLAGTLPQNANSLFRITAVSRAGSNYVASFDAISGKTYRLEYKTDLTDPTWQTASSDFTAPSTGTQQLTDVGGAGGTQRFYRAIVVSP